MNLRIATLPSQSGLVPSFAMQFRFQVRTHWQTVGFVVVRSFELLVSVEPRTRMSRSISFIDMTIAVSNGRGLARLRVTRQQRLPRASTMIYEDLLIITLGDDRGCTLGSFVGIYLQKTCSV
jgi:hypothetical protein